MRTLNQVQAVAHLSKHSHQNMQRILPTCTGYASQGVKQVSRSLSVFFPYLPLCSQFLRKTKKKKTAKWGELSAGIELQHNRCGRREKKRILTTLVCFILTGLQHSIQTNRFKRLSDTCSQLRLDCVVHLRTYYLCISSGIYYGFLTWFSQCIFIHRSGYISEVTFYCKSFSIIRYQSCLHQPLCFYLYFLLCTKNKKTKTKLAFCHFTIFVKGQ